MTEKLLVSLDKDDSRCKDYPGDKTGFEICSFNFLRRFLVNRINCSIPGE